MKKFIFILVLINSFSYAQKTEQDHVKESIEKLFSGMKNADAKIVESAFSENPILQSISKEGIVKTGELKDFLASISGFSKGDLDEKISYVSIQIDGNLASVFTPYEFYLKGKFSHCGANSFQLVKQNNIWKIQYLIDTRRKENCKK